MALFGPLQAVRRRCPPFPGFEAVFAYAEEALTPGSAAHARLQALAPGTSQRHELAGGAYAAEMAYLSKRRPEAFFETHRRFIDVQVVVAGDEWMEVADAAGLTITQPYDGAKDVTKYADVAGASVLRVPAGGAAVFWPEDAHMPSLAVDGPALVRKTVIKVPVAD
jgi:biofilm protein TabA